MVLDHMKYRRIFAIGDIHGCLSSLQGLIPILPINYAQDTLLFIGDYIDRGPASREVIDYLLALKKKPADLVLLMGNHEKMFLDYLNHVNPFLFIFNGGQATLNSYSQQGEFFLPPEHLAFLTSLRPIYETDNYIFVHAGLRPGIPLANQEMEDFLWIRQIFLASSYDFGKKVIFGHTPFSEPLVMPNKIGIDTGAVYGNKLTCIELPAEIFYFF